ncbi:MAG TPA: apolipoprotein N-acyltransferase [Cyanobacteria bacterium UBA8803]|nr:apolipoprotein N-acyltransferase [Cyanobacteria bacterium UBA9273]HBL59732.1 apolipoprotein N-acyltransferase [Cyanobacteria bacterium UBA8803]
MTAISGGILMGLTPAPVQAWPLAWIALVPLWFLVATAKSVKRSSFYGLLWGIGYHGLALSWITGIHPMDWMGVPWLLSIAIALFCWTFITLWGAILVALWAAGMTFLNNLKFVLKKSQFNSAFSALTRVLIGTTLWCLLEAIWSAGSLWWSSLSYTQSPHNLIILHLGQLSGPQMVTAAIVAVNGLMAEAGMHYQHGRELGTRERGIGGEAEKVTLASPHPIVYLSLGIALLLVSHLIGFGLYSRPLIQPTETALKVGIIQGNIPNQIKLYPAGWRRAIEGYTTGYNNLADEGVQAVLTPETALPFIWEEQVRDRSSFYSAILNKGVLAWVGALGQEGSTLSVAEEGSTLSVAEGLGFTNSLFTVSGTGKTLSRYNKVKLVPLGEYIPFEPVVGRLINRLSPLDAHLVAGKPAQIFETPWGRAIVGICYDSTFAEHFRRQAAKGGEFILTASNNAHYSETMPAQHHAQDVMRAIESDRWAVRATNTGYSGIIDPHGRTRWLSGINTYEIHADTVYRRQTQTLYVRWGDWLTSLLLGLAVLAITVMSLR